MHVRASHSLPVLVLMVAVIILSLALCASSLSSSFECRLSTTNCRWMWRREREERKRSSMNSVVLRVKTRVCEQFYYRVCRVVFTRRRTILFSFQSTSTNDSSNYRVEHLSWQWYNTSLMRSSCRLVSKSRLHLINKAWQHVCLSLSIAPLSTVVKINFSSPCPVSSSS